MTVQSLNSLAAPNLSGTNTGDAAQGTALLDFGAFPGGSDAQLVITGQTGILAAAVLMAWIMPAATTDHSSDEHVMESLEVRVGAINAGAASFTLYGINNNPINLPNGQATNIYGKWNVGWRWKN